MNGNRIIVHAVIIYNKKVLVTKRSNEEDVYPCYWDIPGGLVDIGELPRDAVIREIKEEVNLDVIPTDIIHEDSNYDKNKDMIFIRLVYICKLKSKFTDIKLDKKEHSEYKLISDINDLGDELSVPFLKELLPNIKNTNK